MPIVPIATTNLSMIGIAMGMLAIAPSRIPCTHHFKRMALMPMVNPIKVRLMTIDHLIVVVSVSVESGLELAKNIQIRPNTNPEMVAIMTRLVVNMTPPFV